MSDRNPVVAVDIGATKTVLALFDGETMEEFARFPTATEPPDQIEAIVAAVQEDTAAGSASAIGVGAPGPLDAATGTVLAPPNLPGWKAFKLVDLLSSRLDRPVKLENDANVGALGEAVYGSGRGYDSVYYVTISTGIGAGFVINGEVFGGHRGIAGEVYAVEPGHFQGKAGGDNLNELASGPGLIRRTRRALAAGEPSSLSQFGGSFDTYELLAAADAGDRLAVRILEGGRDGIAGLLTTALYTVAPDSIVLAGGLCTENRWFVDPVRERVRNWLVIPELSEVPITRATLWDRAVLYGAAHMVL